MIATWNLTFETTVLVLTDEKRTWLYTLLYFLDLVLVSGLDMMLMATTASRLITLTKETASKVHQASQSNKKTHLMISRLLYSQMLSRRAE
jgi:hypothetical protein